VQEYENRLQGTTRLRPVVVFVTSTEPLSDDNAHSPFGENDKPKDDVCHFSAKKYAVGFGDGDKKGSAWVAVGVAVIVLGTEDNNGVREGLSVTVMVNVGVTRVEVVVKRVGELSGDGEIAGG